MFSFLNLFKRSKEKQNSLVEQNINKSYIVLPVNEFKNNSNGDILYIFSNKTNEKYAVICSNIAELNAISIIAKEEVNDYLNNIGFSVDVCLSEEQVEEVTSEQVSEKIEEVEEPVSPDTHPENPQNSLIIGMQSIAESIKNKRKPSMSAPKPIKVQKYAHYKKALICRDSKGNEYNVGPTRHAIIQFANRYQHIDFMFTPLNEQQIENKIREIFNKGSLSNDERFLLRNGKRDQNRAKDVIWWVSGDVNFVVNLKERTIVTAELTGEHINYNTVRPRVTYSGDPTNSH